MNNTLWNNPRALNNVTLKMHFSPNCLGRRAQMEQRCNVELSGRENQETSDNDNKKSAAARSSFDAISSTLVDTASMCSECARAGIFPGLESGRYNTHTTQLRSRSCSYAFESATAWYVSCVFLLTLHGNRIFLLHSAASTKDFAIRSGGERVEKVNNNRDKLKQKHAKHQRMITRKTGFSCSNVQLNSNNKTHFPACPIARLAACVCGEYKFLGEAKEILETSIVVA